MSKEYFDWVIESFQIKVLNGEHKHKLSFQKLFATCKVMLNIKRFFKMQKFTEQQMSACLQEIAKKDGRLLRCIAAEHNIHEVTARLCVKKLTAIEWGRSVAESWTSLYSIEGR